MTYLATSPCRPPHVGAFSTLAVKKHNPSKSLSLTLDNNIKVDIL